MHFVPLWHILSVSEHNRFIIVNLGEERQNRPPSPLPSGGEDSSDEDETSTSSNVTSGEDSSDDDDSHVS